MLTCPESSKSSLLRFWMPFPLRNGLPIIFKRNAKPFLVMKRPTYLLQPLNHIKNFLSSSMLVQRNNYRQWIQEVSSPKKIAILKPNLDWKRIWMETAAVPTHIREIMFLFNQWLLPTKTRCHRIEFNIDQNCLFRNQDSKTDEHLTLLGTLFGRRDPETRSQ